MPPRIGRDARQCRSAHGPTRTSTIRSRVAEVHRCSPVAEVTDCVFFNTVNTDTARTSDSYHNRMRSGSHHMLALHTRTSSGPSLGDNGQVSLKAAPIAETGSNGPADCGSRAYRRATSGRPQTATLDVDQLYGRSSREQRAGCADPSAKRSRASSRRTSSTRRASPSLREGSGRTSCTSTSLSRSRSWATRSSSSAVSRHERRDGPIPGHHRHRHRSERRRSGLPASSSARATTTPHTTQFTAWATIQRAKEQIIQGVRHPRRRAGTEDLVLRQRPDERGSRPGDADIRRRQRHPFTCSRATPSPARRVRRDQQQRPRAASSSATQVYTGEDVQRCSACTRCRGAWEQPVELVHGRRAGRIARRPVGGFGHCHARM